MLVDEAGRPAGTMPKADVHGPDTPLHLAFSVYLFDAEGHLLVTRRALGKRTWPGVWTNSCCGHPLPGEPSAQAAARRLREELGVRLVHSAGALPDFRYRAAAPWAISPWAAQQIPPLDALNPFPWSLLHLSFPLNAQEPGCGR